MKISKHLFQESLSVFTRRLVVDGGEYLVLQVDVLLGGAAHGQRVEGNVEVVDGAIGLQRELVQQTVDQKLDLLVVL